MSDKLEIAFKVVIILIAAGAYSALLYSLGEKKATNYNLLSQQYCAKQGYDLIIETTTETHRTTEVVCKNGNRFQIKEERQP